MSDLTLDPWSIGIDNVSRDTERRPGSVADAVNVDIARDGSIVRRAGKALALAGSGMHSLWARNGRAYVVRGGELCEATVSAGALSTHPIYTLERDLPLSYDWMNGDVLACNRRESLRIAGDGTVVRLGPQDPGGITVLPLDDGGLDAGRYMVGCSYLRGDEESGLSIGSSATVGAGGGLSLALSQPTESDITAIRIYRTQPGGKSYFRVADVPVGLTPYMLGATPIGREADNLFLRRMPGGHIIRAWKGYVIVARDDSIIFSQPLRYGVTDGRFDMMAWPRRVRIVEPVEGGVFIGDNRGVSFLRGDRPGNMAKVWTGGAPVIEGTGGMIEASSLGSLGLNLNLRGDRFALWLARNGYVLGSPDGQIIELQASRINVPANQELGATVITGRRIITAVQ